MKKIIFLTAMSFAGCAAQQIPPKPAASITLKGPDGGEAVLRGERCIILPSPYGGIPRCDSGGGGKPSPPDADPPATEQPKKERTL